MTPTEKLSLAVDILNNCPMLPQPAQQARQLLVELLADVGHAERRIEPPRFRLPGVSLPPDVR